MKHRVGAWLFSVLLGVLSFGFVTEAWALTTQEIIVMSGQGLSDDVLLTIIRSAEDVPVLTEEDRTKLREAGVSAGVIAGIDERQQKVSTPIASSTTTPIAVGDDAILTPIETSNVPIVFRKFLEEVALTYNVQSEVARQYARLQDETEAVRAHDADIPRVLAWRQEISKSPIRALESCLSLMAQRKPPLNTPLAVALDQCIGFSLEVLEAPGLGAYYLDQALQSESRVYELPRTLSSYLAMAHEWGYSSQDPKKLKEYVRELKGEQRPEFLYFVAYSLVYASQPDTAQAFQILQHIEKGTLSYPRARILLATLVLRAPSYQFKTAAEYLYEAIQALEGDESSEAFELRNMAWLTLGRIAFENHVYDQADVFYRQVDLKSHHLGAALLENAWGQLFSGHHAEAISLAHALHAPIFEKGWFPDLPLIEASAFLGLCRYDMANRILEAYRKSIATQSAALTRYRAHTPSRDYYNQLIRHAETPEKSEIPEGIYRRVLSDLSFQKLHRAVRQLSDERQKLSRYAGSSFSSWSELAAVYDAGIAYYQEQINARIAGIYDEALSELHGLDISSSQLAIEIRLAQRRREAACLKIVASGGHCDEPTTNEAFRTLNQGEQEVFWNFEGEFWRDELTHYVSGLTSLCVE